MIRTILKFIAFYSIINFQFVFGQPDTLIFKDKEGNLIQYLLTEHKSFGDEINDILFFPDNYEGLRLPGIYVKNTIVNDKRIDRDQILDHNGEVILRDLKPHRLSFSKNLNYIGSTRIKRRADLDTSGISTFTLYSDLGEKFFERDSPYFYDASTKFYEISNEGSVLEIDHLGGKIVLLNVEGNPIAEKQFLVPGVFSRWRGFHIDFTSDGKLIALNMTDYDNSSRKSISKMILINLKFETLYEYNLPLEIANKIQISSDGKYVVAGNFTRDPKRVLKTFVFKFPSKEVYELEGYSSLFAKFYPEDLLFSYASHDFVLYDAVNQNEIIRHRVAVSSIFGADYNFKDSLTFVLQGIRHFNKVESRHEFKNVEIVVFNKRGEKISRSEIGNFILDTTSFPLLSCSDNGDKFVLKIDNEIIRYSLIH